jgi:hypothetical protein
MIVLSAATSHKPLFRLAEVGKRAGVLPRLRWPDAGTATSACAVELHPPQLLPAASRPPITRQRLLQHARLRRHGDTAVMVGALMVDYGLPGVIWLMIGAAAMGRPRSEGIERSIGVLFYFRL